MNNTRQWKDLFNGISSSESRISNTKESVKSSSSILDTSIVTDPSSLGCYVRAKISQSDVKKNRKFFNKT